MCCFSQPVRSVSRTRIFGRLTQQRSQYLAYQMKYESDHATAMILPVPVHQHARKRAIRFIDLSGYPDFFEDLERGFPQTQMMTDSRATESPPNRGMLKVHKVGGFEASFVPSTKHFTKLDPRFSIPENIWDKIPAYSNFGFVVFQLKELAGEPHPMAFEFNTRMTDATFLPTMHIHDGAVHQREGFDHTMYVQDRDLDMAAGDYQGHKLWDLKAGWRRSPSQAQQFVDLKRGKKIVAGELKVHRKTMKGSFANEDQIVSRQKLGKDSLGSVDPLVAPTSLALSSMGLGSAWFLKRRQKVMAANVSREKQLPGTS